MKEVVENSGATAGVYHYSRRCCIGRTRPSEGVNTVTTVTADVSEIPMMRSVRRSGCEKIKKEKGPRTRPPGRETVLLHYPSIDNLYHKWRL